MPPQAGEATAQEEAAVADDAAIGVPAALHRRQAHDRLERRTGRESAAQRLVEQRTPLIIGQRPIDLRRHARHEQVGVEGRRRHHGQDVAVAHIHDHAAAGLLAEDFQRAVLDVVVQGQHDLGALNGGLGAGDVLGDHATARIHLDPLAARFAAQVGVQRLLDALTTNAEARVEQDGRRLLALVADRLDVAVRDLGHIADHMGVGAAERIVAGLVHVGHDAGQFGGVQIDLRELLPGQVALDRNRREARGGVDFADQGAPPFQSVRQQLAQKVQGLIQILGLVAHDQDAEAGPVAGDDDAVAILDQAPRRRHQAEVELVVGGKGGVFLGLDDLKLRQTPHQGRRPQRHPPAQQEGAPQEGTLPLVHVREEDMGFAAHRNRTSASSNRWISQSARGKSSSVGTI